MYCWISLFHFLPYSFYVKKKSGHMKTFYLFPTFLLVYMWQVWSADTWVLDFFNWFMCKKNVDTLRWLICPVFSRQFSPGTPVSSTNKTTTIYTNWNIVKSGVKHHEHFAMRGIRTYNFSCDRYWFHM